MRTSWSLEDDPSCIVLRSLQYLDAAGWSAVQHLCLFICCKIACATVNRRKFEPGDKVTFSTKEHWCRTCTAEADRTSPSSPSSKKPGSPLSVSPPKPPRADATVESEGLGLTPSTDKSLYHASCVCGF